MRRGRRHRAVADRGAHGLQGPHPRALAPALGSSDRAAYCCTHTCAHSAAYCCALLGAHSAAHCGPDAAPDPVAHAATEPEPGGVL